MRRDWQSALTAVEEALAQSYAGGDEREVLRNISNLGHVLARQGNYEEALAPALESVQLAHRQQNLFGLAAQLEDLAGVAAGLGRCDHAAAMLGGAEALYESTGQSINPAFGEWRDEIIAQVRQELDAERLSDFWERGRSMSPDELVAFAVAFVDAA